VETSRSVGRTSRYSPWNATSKPSGVTLTYRQVPPTRRSISQIVISPRFACHQRFTSSGVVNAFQTSSAGAANSRVIRICSSVGSDTVAVPLLLAVISCLLFPELVEDGVQRLEALRPGALVLLHPVVDGLERPAVESVDPLSSLAADVHQPHLPKHAQVLG